MENYAQLVRKYISIECNEYCFRGAKMSYGCMYILRGAKNLEELCSKLIRTAKVRGYGLCFDPVNNLLLENSIKLNIGDFVFEVCDSFSTNDSSLLLGYEGYSINGVPPSLPLLKRLIILQDIALACVPHVEVIEIYLGEDTPYLPDYSEYRLACADIADVLYKEYQRDSYMAYIPCVHLIVEK